MRRAPVVLILLALAGCGGKASYVEVPNNHGHRLDDALRRLHEVGLRATFGALSNPCGDGLPWVNLQAPRAPVHARRGSSVTIRLERDPIPSPVVPIHHEKWTTVPRLVGTEFSTALKRLHAIWPCVHVRASSDTDASRIVVVEQKPRAGSRVPAYGVRVGRGYRPTTVDVAVAAR